MNSAGVSSTSQPSLDLAPNTDENGDEDGQLLMMVFLFSFFLVWNVGLSVRVIGSLLAIRSGDRAQGLIDLACPIWIVGIVAPLWLSYRQAGSIACVAALLICVVVPYGANILRVVVLGDDAAEFFSQGTVDPSRSFGCWSFLLGLPSDRQQRQRQPGASFDQPDLLVIKKAKSREEGDDDEDDELSQQSPETCHACPPRSDVLLPSSEVCGICLDEYKEGDDVAWSKSPSCRHVFHASCLKEWLVKKEKPMQVCPVCRESYHLETASDSSDPSEPRANTRFVTDLEPRDLEVGEESIELSEDGTVLQNHL